MAQIRFDFENIKFRNEHVLREEIDSVENSVRIFFFYLSNEGGREHKNFLQPAALQNAGVTEAP